VCGHRFYNKVWPQEWFEDGRFANEIKVREREIEEEKKWERKRVSQKGENGERIGELRETHTWNEQRALLFYFDFEGELK